MSVRAALNMDKEHAYQSETASLCPWIFFNSAMGASADISHQAFFI